MFNKAKTKNEFKRNELRDLKIACSIIYEAWTGTDKEKWKKLQKKIERIMYKIDKGQQF